MLFRSLDRQYLDRITIDYRRLFIATGENLVFTYPNQDARFQIGGLTATPPVIADMQAKFSIAADDVVTTGFFDTLTVRVPGQAARVHARALERRINLRIVDGDHVGISLDETTSPAEIETVWRCFSSSWSRCGSASGSSRPSRTTSASS